MKKKTLLASGISLLLLVACICTAGAADGSRIVEDAAQRRVTLPRTVDRILCSGPGALRLITYLQCQDRIIGVDGIEKRHREFDSRPYALANPQLKTYPLFGEFRGHDNPELIMGLSPLPQVIFKTFHTMGYDPDELQARTGIPVVVLNHGNLGNQRRQLFDSLDLAGRVLGEEKRATQVISFFTNQIADLERRTTDLPQSEQSDCFVGGIASKGPHGFLSTEPGYPPFGFVNAVNAAAPPGGRGNSLSHSTVSKEKLIQWDPDILFLDLSTLQMGERAGGFYELRTDPVFKALGAVESGRVFGLLPYNGYAQNYGSILANAWFIGKLLHDQRFADIDPGAKADEIYSFLVGAPVYAALNDNFHNLAFQKIPLDRPL